MCTIEVLLTPIYRNNSRYLVGTIFSVRQGRLVARWAADTRGFPCGGVSQYPRQAWNTPSLFHGYYKRMRNTADLRKGIIRFIILEWHLRYIVGRQASINIIIILQGSPPGLCGWLLIPGLSKAEKGENSSSTAGRCSFLVPATRT